MQTGAVWIIDDDEDDHFMIQEVWSELNLVNELIFLKSAEEALDRLATTAIAPFVIICELNLPGTDGFQLRETMLATNSKIFKSVPFIWSTHVSEDQIIRAYDLSVHGLFIKDASFEELKKTFTYILNYWLKSKMPSKK